MECVRNIHESLHSGRLDEAVGLLRAAREVWPDNEEFGTADMSSEDEFMVMPIKDQFVRVNQYLPAKCDLSDLSIKMTHSKG